MTLKDFILGKHTTVVAITGQVATIGSSGVTLTDDDGVMAGTKGFSTLYFDALLQMLPVSVNFVTKNIKPTNATRENFLVLGSDYQIQITTLRPILNTLGSGAPLLQLIQNYNYFKISYTVDVGGGSGSQSLVIQAYGSRGAYSGGHEGEEEQTESCSFDCIDVGSGNFTTTYATAS